VRPLPPPRHPFSLFARLPSTFVDGLPSLAEDTREDIVASLTVDLNEFLEKTLGKPATFTLLSPEPGGPRSTVTIMSQYIPVNMQILPRESVNNSGVVRVELVDGKGLPSADRNGKSDPYCEFWCVVLSLSLSLVRAEAV